ncbi:MAG: hypothetical protein PHY73_05455 [Candidatus Omnitrophica bacterium]|nr:hypothetical protein [Candidatus Omnitrophota bacterium]
MIYEIEKFVVCNEYTKKEIEYLFNILPLEEKKKLISDLVNNSLTSRVYEHLENFIVSGENKIDKIILVENSNSIDDKSLIRLYNDGDELMRAKMIESQGLFLEGKDFKSLSFMEKLAYCRSFKYSSDFVEKLIDPDCDELKDEDGRRELILSFFTNKEYIEDSKKGFLDDSYTDGLDACFTVSGNKKICELVFKWLESDPDIVSNYLDSFYGDQDLKLYMYEKLIDRKYDLFRAKLFWNLAEEKTLFQNYNELFEKGINDPYEIISIRCVELKALTEKELGKILKVNDGYTNGYLLRNKNLHHTLMKIILNEIDSGDFNMPEFLPFGARREQEDEFRELYYQKTSDSKQNVFYFLRNYRQLEDKTESQKILEYLKVFYQENRKLVESIKKLLWAVIVILILYELVL